IFKLIPSSEIEKAAKKRKSNHYYKTLPVRVHLVSLLYGVFSYCQGLTHIAAKSSKSSVFSGNRFFEIPICVLQISIL
ncbi:MAG: DUF4372 domain-containing protein, partial [Chitinophagales bacterium]